ncbi:hypothetical protein Y1Q_0019148 [Alligator mississippiensis]|uniref:Uncharacterized protein n=1 Tax=Alligator mississippiensis TaxID=8496 RepID=A0A151MQH4_ALLMI|nr:hypothetical protein Y1Q_0019148 [Alligator mississippiensis]
MQAPSFQYLVSEHLRFFCSHGAALGSWPEKGQQRCVSPERIHNGKNNPQLLLTDYTSNRSMPAATAAVIDATFEGPRMQIKK